MARSTSGDKSQLIAALDILKDKKTLTPTELTKAIGVDIKYASKFVTYLRFYGYLIDANKNGKSVVSYTYVGESANLKPIPTSATRTVKAKAPKKAVKSAMTKEEIKQAAEKLHSLRNASSGAKVSATSFSVDPDWDSVDDVKTLL